MGAGTSKPTSAGSQHVFASETPVQFSQELVKSLQTSSETDGSRAQTLELHIQNRVAEELQRLQERESQILADIQSKLSSDSATPTSSPTSPDSPASTGLASLLPGLKKDDKKDVGRESVLKEIEGLKERLGQRKKLIDVDKDVEKARDEVAHCLRMNDRRPLDCWKEVARFKDEVARMEGKFVERVMN